MSAPLALRRTTPAWSVLHSRSRQAVTSSPPTMRRGVLAALLSKLMANNVQTTDHND
jgi:hypothetical protein